jgi:hypothetical protein
VDRKPKNSVTQWVAETSHGDVQRVLEENNRKLSAAEQQKKIDGYLRDSEEQAKRRKAGQHDDDQATELLKLLPDAFAWSITGNQGGKTILHFKPDSKFHPPDREARVFAAMEAT